MGVKIDISDSEGLLIDESERVDGSERAIDWSISASSVIFGAILSAYAGVKISSLPENYFNAVGILFICICHVFFLFCITMYSVKIRNMPRKTKFLYISAVAMLSISAAIVWHFIFGTSLFYSVIIFGWFCSHLLLAGIIDHARLTAEDKMAILEKIVLERFGIDKLDQIIDPQVTPSLRVPHD